MLLAFGTEFVVPLENKRLCTIFRHAPNQTSPAGLRTRGSNSRT